MAERGSGPQGPEAHLREEMKPGMYETLERIAAVIEARRDAIPKRRVYAGQRNMQFAAGRSGLGWSLHVHDLHGEARKLRRAGG